jgi:hypothetical protein
VVTDWYNSLKVIELSPEFQILAGAVIGRQEPSDPINSGRKLMALSTLPSQIKK